MLTSSQIQLGVAGDVVWSHKNELVISVEIHAQGLTKQISTDTAAPLEEHLTPSSSLVITR